MFKDDNKINPLSTVHLQAEAIRQGQVLYSINSSNLQSVLSDITTLDPDTETDIINSVNAGQIVNIHESALNIGNWLGFGYVIYDPETGSGVYMIDGRTMGGGPGCIAFKYIQSNRFAGDYCKFIAYANSTLMTISAISAFTKIPQLLALFTGLTGIMVALQSALCLETENQLSKGQMIMNCIVSALSICASIASFLLLVPGGAPGAAGVLLFMAIMVLYGTSLMIPHINVLMINDTKNQYYCYRYLYKCFIKGRENGRV